MKKTVIFIIMCMSISFVWSETNEEKAIRAEDYYRQGDFENALILYHDIEQDRQSFGLYYNLGNTYFKTAQYAKAKLYYLRAQRIRPSDRDVAHNLRSVEMRLTDAVKLREEPRIITMWLTLKNLLSFNALLTISAGIWLCVVLLWAFMRHKLSKPVMWFLVSIASISLLITVIRMNEYREKSYILLVPEVQVASEPLETSSTIFTIHAGIEFAIREKVDTWYLIVLKNGFRGWIKTDAEPIFEKI